MMKGMRRLHPDPTDEVSVEECYAQSLGHRADRPWVSLSMVTSIDGSAAVDGTSGALSSPTDSAVLIRLRAIADVIIVGSGTAHSEGYGPPSKAGQRIGVVTAGGRVDLASELFTSGAGFVITTAGGTFDPPPEIDVIRAGSTHVDLVEAVRRLPELCPGTRVVQAEGGPTLSGSLLDADLIDEINATTSAATVGGGGPRLASGSPANQRGFEVAQLALDDQSFVYTRWLRRTSGE